MAKPVPAKAAPKTMPRNGANAAFAQQVAYKGAVPIKDFLLWLVLVVLAACAIGLLTAQMLVSQRFGQLVDETSTRVAIRAETRAQVVGEWLQGVQNQVDALALAETPRLFMAERLAPGADPELTAALQAQTPYLERWLQEFLGKQGASGVQLLQPDGAVVLQAGEQPDSMANLRPLVQQVQQTGKPLVLPLRSGGQSLSLEVLRPMPSMAEEGANGPLVANIVGVVWARFPASTKLQQLIAASPLDRPGERTALVQYTGDGAVGTGAELVGKHTLQTLPGGYEALAKQFAQGRALSLSVVDEQPVFALLAPIAGAPLAVLQEYVADQALRLMGVYTPGIYVIVGLAVLVLGALMLALTLHLLGQRNRTRVHLLGQTMEALVRVVEARDPHLSGHHSKVARLAVLMGNTLKLSVGERATLFYAAQLSAVGRLLVPRDLLAKKSKLTPEERQQLEGHIQHATTILRDLDFDLPITAVIAQMYEREDGSGHPHGLKGCETSRMAKVLGACDAYVAMTTDRAHRKALSKSTALSSMDGGAFAPDILAALKDVAR
jgi:HD-GYP domain-containing protein (c-di-GMP phosphodiesterase class II)